MSKDFIEKWLADPQNHSLLVSEGAAVNAAYLLGEALHDSGISQAELARRLGKSRSYVTQLLYGNKNLTLRSLALALDAMGYELVQSKRPKQSNTESAPNFWAGFPRESRPHKNPSLRVLSRSEETDLAA